MRQGWGWVALVALGCDGKTTGDDAPVDGIADSDSDTDTDADSDSDTDADADTDALSDDDGDGFTIVSDCDDADATVYPGAPDVCGDDRATDCDRVSDDGLVTVDGRASFTDLQQALDAAEPGAELRVCPGIWEGNFASAVPVRLVGHAGADVTRIAGGGVDRALALPGDSAITGLTIRGGRTSEAGGGVWQSSPGTFALTDCVIEYNRAGRGGGIALAEGSQATLSGVVVHHNAGEQGGGLYVPVGASADLGSSTLTGNTAEAGGGLWLEGATLIGGVVEGNAATGDEIGGGGVHVQSGGTLVGTEIVGNDGAGRADGLSIVGGEVELADVSVRANLADQVTHGAGMYIQEATVSATGTTAFVDHVAPFSWGVVYVRDGALLGGRVENNEALVGAVALTNSVIENVVVEDNRSSVGGGVSVFGTTEIVGGRIARNVAQEGGGVATPDAWDEPVSVTLRGVEIVDNRATYAGGGISAELGTVTIEGATILRNTADSWGGGVWIRADASVVSTDTDWGAGADDNLPGDVYAGTDLVGYGADASFSCDALACVPAP